MNTKQISHFPINDNSNGWSRILPPRPPKSALSGQHRVNWVVIGGGYVGLAAARRLAENRPDDSILLLEAGVVGDLKMIHGVFTFHLTRPDNIRWLPEFGGGALMDVGCYCINVSRTITNSEPVEVQALATWASTGVDDMMSGTIRFVDDVLASFECGLNTKRRESYEIGGTDACLRVADAFLPGTDEVFIEEMRDGEEPVLHAIAGIDEYQCMVEHFADCVLNDRQPRYSADEAALNMRVIEALYESVRNGGRPVSVDRNA